MATTTYLAGTQFLVGAVDLTDQLSSATLNYTVTPLSDLTMASVGTSFVAGLQDNELTATLFLSYVAAEVYATLQPLVGTVIPTITLTPADAAVSATNPAVILSGSFLSSLPVINATAGELSTVDITFMGGVVTFDVTP
jgi:hypothetical protein